MSDGMLGRTRHARSSEGCFSKPKQLQRLLLLQLSSCDPSKHGADQQSGERVLTASLSSKQGEKKASRGLCTHHWGSPALANGSTESMPLIGPSGTSFYKYTAHVNLPILQLLQQLCCPCPCPHQYSCVWRCLLSASSRSCSSSDIAWNLHTQCCLSCSQHAQPVHDAMQADVLAWIRPPCHDARHLRPLLQTSEGIKF